MTRTQAQSPPTLEEVVDQVQSIATLPHVALRIMEVANDPDSGAWDLKEVLEGDASLTSRVLRTVNCSHYATRGDVANLQQAIAYLGMQQIRNLAISASVSDLFKGKKKIGLYDRAGLWRHMGAVAVCARFIAMRLNFKSFEDIFLAGLLHDVGIILADQHVHDLFTEVVQSLTEDETLCETERRVMGFDHTTLGAMLAKRWQFPEGVADTIEYHHNSADYQGQYLDTVRCVEVANFICSLKDMTSVGQNVVEFSTSAFDGLGLTNNDVVVLAEDLDQELASSNLLQM